jgi:hypothetical protein
MLKAMGLTKAEMLINLLSAAAIISNTINISFLAAAKASPGNPCQSFVGGYPNGYNSPDSNDIQDKTVAFTNGIPSYRVIRAVTNSQGLRMANIEWKESGSIRTAWVNSWALSCQSQKPPKPMIPPFALGDSLDEALASSHCSDLQPSGEWALNPATGSDSRKYVSQKCGVVLTFSRNNSGKTALMHGRSSMQAGGGYLLTNEGIGVGSTEVEAVASYGSRSIPEFTRAGVVLSVDDAYKGYIFMIENSVINSVEFGLVRE